MVSPFLEHQSNFNQLRSVIDLLSATRYSQIILYGQMPVELVEVPGDVEKEVIYLHIEDEFESQVMRLMYLTPTTSNYKDFRFPYGDFVLITQQQKLSLDLFGRWTQGSEFLRIPLSYKRCPAYFKTKKVHQVHYFDIAPGAMRFVSNLRKLSR